MNWWYIFIAMLYACHSPLNNKQMDQDKTITVTGTALNAKAGAVVRTADGSYYIRDLSAWPDSLYNKQVEVQGTLTIIDHSKDSLQDEDGEYTQSMRGLQRIIEHAEWKALPEQ